MISQSIGLPSSLLRLAQVPKNLVETVKAKVVSDDPLGMAITTTKAHHEPTRNPLAALFAEAYVSARDHVQYHHEQTPTHLITDFHREHLQGYRFLGTPGVLNFLFGHTPMELWAHAASHGAAMMSVSGSSQGVNRGTYQILGGSESVHHANWREEMATIIERIFFDIQSFHPNDRDFRYVFLGHSKGGLLVKELAMLAAVEGREGAIPNKLAKNYPGLELVQANKKRLVFDRVRNSIVFPTLSPLEGIDERTKKLAKYSMIFEMLFPDLAAGFYPESVSRIHDDYNFQETFGDVSQLLGGIIYAERQPGGLIQTVRRHMGKAHKDSWRTTSYLKFVDGFFDILGALTSPEGKGDGLVAVPSGAAHPHELRLRGHHLEIVESPEYALQILDFVTERIASMKNE